mgnify:CR=1 FL=1
MRVDVFLWNLRYFKSRNLASQACKNGNVKMLDKTIKSSKEIFVGDEISIKKNRILKKVSVLKLPKNRIGAKLVNLYRKEKIVIKNYISEISYNPSSIKREKGTGRPTKKERREIDKHSKK